MALTLLVMLLSKLSPMWLVALGAVAGAIGAI